MAREKVKDKSVNIDEAIARDAARIIHADPKNQDSPWADTLIRIKKHMAAHNEGPIVAEMEAAANTEKLPYRKEFVQNQINIMKRRQRASAKSIREFEGITPESLGSGSRAAILRAEHEIVRSGISRAVSQLQKPNTRKTVLPYLSFEMAEYSPADLAAHISRLTCFPVRISIEAAQEMLEISHREKAAYMDTKIWLMTMFMPVIVASRERLPIDDDDDEEEDSNTGTDTDISENLEKYPDTS